jgi:hypothetical protein
MTSDRRAFDGAYGAALRSHIEAESEQSLRAAYELGRDAVVRELSVLDLAGVHHEALLDSLRGAAEAGELERATRAAGAFFLEGLAAFEMVQRGVREARVAATAERSRSTMLRQLTSLLADPSLALDGSGSIHEALRLVAEEARELTGAAWCVATAALGGRRPATEAAGPVAAGPAALVRPADLVRRHALVAEAGGVARLGGPELADHPAFAGLDDLGDVEGPPALTAWLAASLTSLDGRELGCLEVFGSDRGSFSELDEALLVHVAQLASAALERAQLHRRPR